MNLDRAKTPGFDDRNKTFKEIIHDDLDAAEAVLIVYDIPLDISSDLQNRLGELKNEIKATLQKVKK